MRRVNETVSLELAKERLTEYAKINGTGLFNASQLADVIWPDASFISSQGAGSAASRVLKKLGCQWISKGREWGWSLMAIS